VVVAVVEDAQIVVVVVVNAENEQLGKLEKLASIAGAESLVLAE
jgi:hypothetical protein